jgi:hypothetical protein
LLGCGAVGLADGLLGGLTGAGAYLGTDDPAAIDDLTGFIPMAGIKPGFAVAGTPLGLAGGTHRLPPAFGPALGIGVPPGLPKWERAAVLVESFTFMVSGPRQPSHY